jgi:hypothetical protein
VVLDTPQTSWAQTTITHAATVTALPRAVAFRAAFMTPEGADTYRQGLIGLMNNDTSQNGLAFGEYYTWGDHTKIAVQNGLVGALTATSLVVDNGVLHDWLLLFDGTHLRLLCDGVIVYSSTFLTYFQELPAFIGGAGVYHHVDITQIAFGYVKP